MADAGSDVRLVFGVDQATYDSTNLGSIKTYLENITNTVYKIRFDANMSEAQAKVNDFRSSLSDITMNITLDQGNLGGFSFLIDAVNQLDINRLTTMRDIFNDLRINPQAAQSIRDLNEALMIIAMNPVLQSGLLQRAQDAYDLTNTPTVSALEQLSTSMHKIIDSTNGLNAASTDAMLNLAERCSAVDAALEEIGRSATQTGEVIRNALGNQGLQQNMGVVSSTRNMMTEARNVIATESQKIVVDLQSLENKIQNALNQHPDLAGTQWADALRNDLEQVRTALDNIRSGSSAVEAMADAFERAAHPIDDINSHLKSFDGEGGRIKAVTKAIDDYYKAAIKATNIDGLTKGRGQNDPWVAQNSSALEYAKNLNTLKRTMDELMASADSAGVSQESFATLTEHAALMLEQYNRAAEEAAHKEPFAKLVDLQERIGSLQYEIAKLDPQLDSKQIENFKAKLADAQQKYNALLQTVVLTSKDIERLAEIQQKYQDKIDNLNSTKYDEQKNAVADLLKDLKELAQVNPNAPGLQQLISDTEKLSQNFDNLTPDQRAAELRKLGEAFSQLSGSATKGLSSTANGLDMLESRIVRMFSIAEIIRSVWKEIREMVKTVNELDEAFTQLRVVTDATESEFNQFYTNISVTAKEIGASITELTNAATTYARLGYDINESSTLSKYTTMLQNVGAIDSSSAQDAVTAIVKAFDIDVSNIETVMDKIVAVGNNFPISVQQIAEGMNNAGSSLHAAGNSLEQSIALLTAANTTVQNVSKASTALRTLTARIRKTSVDLDDLGETIEESKYEEVIGNLTKHNVALTDMNGEYRTTYEIMKDIAAVWNELTSMEQAAVAEQLAGTRQQNIFFSIIEQFQEAENAMITMGNSAGALSTAYDTYMDSMKASTDMFKASFQDMSKSAFNPTILSEFIKWGAKVVEILGGIFTAFEKIGGILPVVAGVFGSLFVHSLPKIVEGYSNVVTLFKAITTGATAAGGALKALSASSGWIGLAITAVTAAVSLAISISKSAEEARREAERSATEYANNIDQSRNATEQYAERIADLKNKIEEEKLSGIDLYNTQKELLDIKNDLIDAYGEQAESIDILGISAEEAAQKLAELQLGYEKTIANNFLIDNAQKIEDATKKMESIRGWGAGGQTLLSMLTLGDNQQTKDVMDRLRTIAAQYKGIIIDEAKSGDSIEYEINFTADATDARDTLTSFTSDVRDLIAEYKGEGIDINDLLGGNFSVLERELSDAAARAGNVIEKWGRIYEESLVARIAANDSYSKLMSQYKDAAEEYENAVNGSYESESEKLSAVNSAIAKLELAKAAIADTTFGEDDKAIESYLTGLVEDLENASKQYTLKLAFKTDLDPETKSIAKYQIQKALEQFAKDESGRVSALDLLIADQQLESNNGIATDNQTKGIMGLRAVLAQYNMTVADSIQLLAEYGYVNNDVTASIEEQTVAIATAFERIKVESGSVSKAISEQGANGSLSLETYNELLTASEDYAGMLKNEGGVIQLDTDAARNLLKAKTELKIAEIDLQRAIDLEKWKENSTRIDELSASYATLEDDQKSELEALRAENQQIGQNIDKYSLMQSELYELISAYQAWKDAQNEPESGDMYDDTQKALQQLQEGLESGKTGTAKYKASVELLVPEANRDDVAAYTESLKRYITEDATGIGNFLADMIDAGLMERNGNEINLKPNVSVQDIVDALNITPEMAKAIFGELEEYDFHFDWTDEDFIPDFSSGLTSIGEFDQAIADCDQKILDLKKQIADLVLDKDLTPEIKTEKLQEAYDQLEGLNEQRDKLSSARESLINADSSESTLTELQKIITSEEDIATKLDQLAAMSMGDLGSTEAYQLVQLLYGALKNLNDFQIADKSYTVTQRMVTVGGKGGAATAKGTKDAPGGTSLVGELGRELVVSDNKYYTVGDFGAEFVHLKPGDIVFSHEDTEKIFRNVSGARGKAFAEGNAYAMSNLKISGGGKSDFIAQLLDTGTGTPYTPSSTSTASYVEDIADAVDDVTESVEELDDELKEMLENMKKEMDEIIGNYEHSIFLLEKNGGSVAAQIAVYEEMMRAVHDQANEYRALGLDDNNDYIQELQKQWWEYHDKIIDLTVDAYEQVLKERENILSLDEKHLNAAVQMGDTDEANRIAQKMIEEYRQMQEDLHAEAEYYRSLGYSDTSDEVSKLSVQWWEYEEKIADVMEAVRERIVETYELAVQQAENAITLNQNWLENAQSRGDRTGVVKYTNQIVDYYKQMQKEIHEEAEYYRSLGYSDTSEEVSKLSDLWWDYQHNITDAISSAYESIVSETNGIIDDIQNVYSTLQSAADEFAENEGFISVDTFQQIAALGPQYMSLLRDQNGELVISEANINAIIAAKTRQLAVDTALNYIQQLSAAAANNDTVALKNLVNATNLATTSTWSLVYARLAEAKLQYDMSDEDYQQAKRNIDSMRSLAENAVAGIGKVGATASKTISSASKSSTDALNKQKDALDDILKYVKAMIKQEIKDQVEALKQQISDYKKIVDLQKKSLDLEKEKNDYTKSVEEKTAEIAKLQQRIYMLDLDNSREANAEKLELQEQLAKLQEDLAEKQADKARDTTKDMLDDMAEAYEDEKNEEIDILEDSISSEEKLYQKAIERIETHWDTLYDELIAWNTQYGNVLNSEITSAWGVAESAARKYGSYLAALEETTKRIAEASSKVSVSSSSSYNSSGSNNNNDDAKNTKVGDLDLSGDFLKKKVAAMKENSALWHTASDGDVTEEGSRKWLANKNQEIANEIQSFLQIANPDYIVERRSSGDWYIVNKKTGEDWKLYDAVKTLHSGGIVGGDGTVRQDETFAKLQNGEMVLNSNQQKTLFRVLGTTESIFSRIGNFFDAIYNSSIANAAREGAMSDLSRLAESGDGMVINVSPEINISVASVSDQNEITKLGKQISDITIDNILDAFAKRGKIGSNRALLRP